MDFMDKVTASVAKQNFGDLLARAAVSPVGIERHGQLVAAMVPADWVARAHLLDGRRRAREEQKQVEQNRLMAHQRLGIELLSRPERKARLLKAAKGEVRRWAQHNLCSPEYIERWSLWLSLPAAELVERMCSDAEGWGSAMRQNSPFAVSFR